MRSVTEADGPLQMLVNFQLAAGQRITPLRLFDLQHEVVVTERIVARHGSFMLQREDQIEILTATGNEGGAQLFRGLRKLRIELSDVARA